MELLVQQMAGAKDLHDARSRASQVLQAFEQAVLQQASQVCTFTQSLACNSLHVYFPLPPPPALPNQGPPSHNFSLW